MKRTLLPRPGARSMRGLTLVELMISLVIGLVIMIAVVSAYLGSAGASAVAQAHGRMNEDAQAALAILTQHLRMAGNNPKQAGFSPAAPRNPVFAGANTWPIRGCDSTFTDSSEANTSALACSGGGADAISVAYEADPYNTVRTAANAATDCLGNALAAVNFTASTWDAGLGTLTNTPRTYTFAENRFYVATTSGGPSLFCDGNGGSAQPLVENIEDMQVLYGTALATATSTLTVAGYLTADEVQALPNPPWTDDQNRWARVATVRICLIVRSDKPVAPNAESAQYIGCDGNTIAPADLFVRRAYTTTVVLRNRIAS